jgi:hypothetical protein
MRLTNRPARVGRLASIVGTGVLLVAVAMPVSVAAGSPGDCSNDSKLIGPILLSSNDAPGTWWGLTRAGFDAAGITDYKATIEGFFGTSFDTLDDAVDALVAGTSTLDKNGNGYVCASSARGTRAFLDDPQYANYFFQTHDDKGVK